MTMQWATRLAVAAVVPAAALAFWGAQLRGGRPVAAPVPAAAPPSSGAAHGASVTVSPEQIQNAQIRTEAATAGSLGPERLRTTGVVEPNAYKELPVVAPAGGVVAEVKAQLGDHAFQGTEMAVVISAELAQAAAEYLKLLHDVEHLHPTFNKTKQLYDLGAASRDDLQRAETEFRNRKSDLLAARRRLEYMDVKPAVIGSLHEPGGPEEVSRLAIFAPITGRVVRRSVNVNERISAGAELFRVADLSRVWVIAHVYEDDLGAVKPGMGATITSPAYLGRRFSGQVSYIDSRVDAQTRTVQVRIETMNGGEALKLGMYVDVELGGGASAGSAVLIPAAAVQAVAGRRVVYVETAQPGTFEEREVTAGPERNLRVPVYRGLAAGDRVVVDGAFLLRAESVKRRPPPHVH